MPPSQLGSILYRYSITTHTGNWIEGRPGDFGRAVCNPPMAVMVESDGEGNLPESLSFCQIDSPNVMLMTMKKAEDEQGVILRLNETEGRETQVSITLPHMAIDKAYKTNLVESNEELLDVQGETIRTAIGAFGVETIRIHYRTINQ